MAGASSDGRLTDSAYLCISLYLNGNYEAPSQMAELQVAEVPREIAVGPEYGLAILKGADPRATDLALFMLSPDGQQIFSRDGFAPIALPAPER